MSTDQAGASATVALPGEVAARLEDSMVIVKGPLGEVRKDFSRVPVRLSFAQGEVRLSVDGARKKEVAILNTARSHIRNMVVGVTKGFTYRLKVVYAHFPISIKVKGNHVSIENFYGERSPRVSEIVGRCQVSPQGDDLLVKGCDKEAVAATAANIEKATRVKKRDPRVFLDGLYVYSKEVGS